VVIVRDDYGDVLGQSLTHSADDLGIGVGIAFRYHRAVKAQQHAVELGRRLDAFDQFSGQSVESPVRHHSTSLGTGQ
jgi:hypothetical protein